MRQIILLLFTFLTFTLNVSAGSSDLPNSYVSTGLGFGTSYGILGTKTVVGYKNSGLLIGLGYLPGGVTGYAVGGQISANWFYTNISYCVYGYEQLNGRSANALTAGNFMLGGMINLDGPKRFFLDLSLGHTFSAESSELDLNGGSNNTLNLGIGFLYRIGG